MNKLGLLKKSRLMQLVVATASLGIVVAVVYPLTSLILLPVIGSIVALGLVVILAARVIQLEWQVATLRKVDKKRRGEIDSKIAALGLRIREELKAEIRKDAGVSRGNRRPSGQANNLSDSIPTGLGPIFGRSAAGTAVAADREAKLHEMLNQQLPPASRTHLLGVMSPGLRDILTAKYHVQELVPAIVDQQIQESAARMLVIDEQAFRSGPWFGADSAEGTLLLARLTQAIQTARELDLAVWFIATGATPRPYTQEFKRLATGIIGVDSIDNTWSEDIYIQFYNLVDEYVHGITTASQMKKNTEQAVNA